jgi:uroporphyrinogen-III synthase
MKTRVLVTRSSDQAGVLETALHGAGLTPVLVPAIAVDIDPPGGSLDATARRLPTFEWLVVTSANGARAILTAAARVFTTLEGPSWAAIGDATGEVLEREGIRIDFLPSRADARTLAAELPIRPRDAVAVFRGDLAGNELPHRLRDRGAGVTDVIAYRTIEAPLASGALLRSALAPGRPDAVAFASGSAVRGLVAIAQAEQLDVRCIPAVCIGSETAREAARCGFEVIATSATPDALSLAGTVAAALRRPQEIR